MPLLVIFFLFLSLSNTAWAGAWDSGTTGDAYQEYQSLFIRAREALPRLGTRQRDNLAAVLQEGRILRQRRLLRTRIKSALLTLERNYQWFVIDRHQVGSQGERRRFPGSRLIWQFYTGQGWQLQILANFSKLSAWADLDSGVPDSAVASYADELLDLSVKRGDFRAFEYIFPYGGDKSPNWVSAMATAAALQALARASKRLSNSSYALIGEELLPVFETGPPLGVRVSLRNGPHYLLYSQSPRLLVANAFAFSIIGLRQFGQLTGSEKALGLADQGQHRLLAELNSYNPGGWSYYNRFFRGLAPHYADLSYHRLYADFLDHLCLDQGGAFCSQAQRLTKQESDPVTLNRMRISDSGNGPLNVRLGLDKPAEITLSLWKGMKLVDHRGQLRSATPTITVPVSRRRAGGKYRIKVELRSPTGLRSSYQRWFWLSRRD